MQPNQSQVSDPYADALNIFLYAIPIILLALVTLASGSVSVGFAGTASQNFASASASQEASETSAGGITNPDYAKNPSLYSVDTDDAMASTIPLNQALWVEGIVDATTVRVSYTVQQAGAPVLDVQELAIPNLRTPLSVNHACWAQRAKDFLSQNLLHRVVYLVRDDATASPYIQDSAQNMRLLMESPGPMQSAPVDVAMHLVSDGYGAGSSYELRKAEEVAKLSNRGLWSTCRN